MEAARPVRIHIFRDGRGVREEDFRNRWKLFSDDELATLHSRIADYDEHWWSPIDHEIAAEIERRST